MKWEGLSEKNREDRNKLRNSILVRKSEGKKTLDRPRRKWQESIKTYPQRIGYQECGLDSAGS
jgi:hypothetical protein